MRIHFESPGPLVRVRQADRFKNGLLTFATCPVYRFRDLAEVSRREVRDASLEVLINGAAGVQFSGDLARDSHAAIV